MNMKRVNIFSL